MFFVNDGKNRRSRGSILVTTFFICTLAALSTVWMVRTLLDHQRANRRRRELKNAYFAAQAGVQQVLQWANYPNQYDNLDELGFFYRDMTSGEFPNMTAAFATSSEIVVTEDKLSAFTSKYNTDVAKISEIRLIAPDPDNDPVPCLLKVRSEGIAPGGASRRILAYLLPNPIDTAEVELGAGLISLSTVAVTGNADVRWGECWSRQPLSAPSESQAKKILDSSAPQYDPFARYRTESNIIFTSTWSVGVGKEIYDPNTRRFPGAAPAIGNYEAALEQFIPEGELEWPDFKTKYQAFKNHARSHGRYYSTDINGNIYRDGIEDVDHLVDFNIEFGNADRANTPYDLVFIDTVDSNPPTPYDNPANLATIKNSGTGVGMKGVYYVCANIEQTGQGNPADLMAEKLVINADGSLGYVYELIRKVYLDGVLYSMGTIDYGGNPTIYGSVVSEGGFTGGGTPLIYFNPRLRDGLEIPHGNIGSVLHTQLLKNF